MSRNKIVMRINTFFSIEIVNFLMLDEAVRFVKNIVFTFTAFKYLKLLLVIIRIKFQARYLSLMSD